MPIELKMPALSPTMEEGTLAKWLVKEGDKVDVGRHPRRDRDRQGDDGVRGGRRRHDRQDPGARGHRRREGRRGDRDARRRGRRCQCSRERRAQGRHGSARRAEGAAPEPKADATPKTPQAPRNAGRSAAACRRVRHAPRATASRRRRSPGGWPQAQGIDLSTHPGQRPRRPDRPRRHRRGCAAARQLQLRRRSAAGAAPALGGHLVMPGPMEQAIPHEAVKLSNMRKTIARRLTESKQQVPHIYLTVDIQLDALLKLRGELNAGPREPRRQALRQRPADQGARPGADRSAGMQRQLRRRPAAQIQPRRHFGRGVDPGRPDHADHRRRRHARASRRSRPR